MSKKRRDEAVAEWSQLQVRIRDARERRGLAIGVDGADPGGAATLLTQPASDDDLERIEKT